LIFFAYRTFAVNLVFVRHFAPVLAQIHLHLGYAEFITAIAFHRTWPASSN